MCGIAGFINFNDNNSLSQQACITQQHRGPDSQRTWSHENLSFSHQRLSIIDLDARSDQPFHKENLTIIFNGEIYNYKELKEQLIAHDPSLHFKTTSDTEVLLELYRLKKEKCLDDVIGMFAFAIYDSGTRKLFIARDHFGIKPLFYTRINNAFAFSSELKTLTQLPGFDRTINIDALVGSINYLWVPGDISMFRNTYKLPAAHYMIIDTAAAGLTTEVRRYWTLKISAPVTNEIAATDALDKEMEASIQRHMVADVPVSCFLSGGLDSSLIAVLAARHTKQLSTYTIATTDEDKKAEQMPEDEVYARKVATEQGFDHHEIMVKADIVNDLKKMVFTLDEPIGDPAAINTYLICKAAREKGVKVLLSGMGADELFFGYRRQKATLLAERYKKLPSVIRKLIRGSVSVLPVKIGGKGVRLTRWAKRFLSFADMSTEEAYMRSYSYYDQPEMQQLFKADIGKSYQKLRHQHKGFFDELYQGDAINQMCNTDIHLFMQGLNLTYTDRASMAASVEVRVPFIDRQMVTLAMSLPGSLKFKNKQSKYILKKVAEKYLPADIIYRPKASFGAPIRSWISGALRPVVDELLSPEVIEKRGFLHYGYIKKLIEDDRTGKADNAYRLYQLITLEWWFRCYYDQQQFAAGSKIAV